MKKHLLTLSILLLSHSMAHAAQDTAPARWQAPAAAARAGLTPLPQGGRPDITPLLQSMTNLVQALTKALLNVEISPVSMGPLPVADAGVGKAGQGFVITADLQRESGPDGRLFNRNAGPWMLLPNGKAQRWVNGRAYAQTATPHQGQWLVITQGLR